MSKASPRANRKRPRRSTTFFIQLVGVALLASFMAAIGLVKEAVMLADAHYNLEFPGGSAPISFLIKKNASPLRERRSMAERAGMASLQADKGNGKLTETILHNFPGSPSDGIQPTKIGSAGEIYGSTTGGRHVCTGGVVYKLVEPANKLPPWTETILYQFTGGGNGTSTDGSSPGGSRSLRKAICWARRLWRHRGACGMRGGQPQGCGTLRADAARRWGHAVDREQSQLRRV